MIHKNYIFRIQLLIHGSGLTHWHPIRPKRAWAFVPLVMSSPFTEKGHMYAQVVEEDEIFPMTPKPESLGWWNLRYVLNFFQILVENSEENFPFPPFANPWQEFPVSFALFRGILRLKASLAEGQQLKQRDSKRRKRKGKKTLITTKSRKE